MLVWRVTRLAEPNDRLRAAREATESRRVPDTCVSRGELAELVNQWVDANTNRHGALDENYVARLEQGRVRWPGKEYRAGFRAVLRAAEDEQIGFKPPNRRPISPLAALPDVDGLLTPDDTDHLLYVAERPRQADRAALDSLAVVLGEQRRLEDSIGAAPLVAPVRCYLSVLESMVIDARGALRPEVVDMAAQWAQFTAWLYAATDLFDLSNKWFDRTHVWATEVDNPTLMANVLSFKGHIASLTGHVGPLIGLTQAAQRDARVDINQRAYDAIQEARGHAMAGDSKSADHMLGKAKDLAAMFAERPDEVAPSSYYYTQPLFGLERGVVLQRLGRHAEAADQIAVGLSELPQGQANAEWTGTYRQALAAARRAE